MKELDDTANRLMMTHPDQSQNIYDHQKEINERWNNLTEKVSLPFLLFTCLRGVNLKYLSRKGGGGSSGRYYE